MTWKCSRDVDLDGLIDQFMDMMKSNLTPIIQKEKIVFEIKGKVVLDKKAKKSWMVLDDL